MASFAAIACLVAVVLWTNSTAFAQRGGTSAPAANAGAAPAVTYDPKLFEVPPPNEGLDKLKFGSGSTALDSNVKADSGSKLNLPGPVKVGKSVLQFDTKGIAADPNSRVGIERNDPTVLNQGTPAQKSTPLSSGYIGLKLSAPTH